VSSILGHECVVVPTESGRRFVAVCSCGFTSKTWATTEVGAEKAVAHIRWVLKDFDQAQAQGRPFVHPTFYGDPDRTDWWAPRVTDKALKDRYGAPKRAEAKQRKRKQQAHNAAQQEARQAASTNGSRPVSDTGVAS
jgi:hypothetical protein